MIRVGVPSNDLEPYLLARGWLVDAARLLRREPGDLAAELVDGMVRSTAIVTRDGRMHTAADHAPVVPATLDVPFPREWPR